MDPTISPSQPPAARRSCLSRLLAFSVRLIFVILLGTGIGAGLYYGMVQGYRQIVEPMRRHTNQLAELESRLDSLSAGAAATQSAQTERLATLEANAARLENALAIESTAHAPLANNIDNLQTAVAASQTETAKLNTALATLTPAAAQSLSQTARLEIKIALLHIRGDLLEARLQLLAENAGEARRLLADSSAALRALMEPPTTLAPEARAALIYRLTSAETLLTKEPYTALTEIESVATQLEQEILQPTAQPTSPGLNQP